MHGLNDGANKCTDLKVTFEIEACSGCGQAEKLAALQRRLDEVIAMHQQAVNESEALRVRPCPATVLLA